MLTYELKKAPGLPLYEALYRCIRADIQSGVLRPGEKLPSKRALAANLRLSKITVEAAYTQLLEEGYIRATEKVGYFVEEVSRVTPSAPAEKTGPEPAGLPGLDLAANGSAGFPFSVWSRLQREVMLDYGGALLLPLPNRGVAELRQAIAAHLGQFRGMHIDPANILVGAGTDFLYNLLIQLLGRDLIYAVEDPGYDKTRRVYAAAGAACVEAPLDAQGVRPDRLGKASVLHCSPSHHYPTGVVTPVSRRMELLEWAAAGDRYIIEDDYDSEFRFRAHPVPALQTLDRAGRVIYMNTFSKTLAPSIRISYLVLPPRLMERFQQKLGFYSCTVPSFEQYTLARFLSRGYFEKHINRMRKFYKTRRNQVLQRLQNCCYHDRLTVLERDAGLHFLLKVDTELSDGELTEWCGARGIRVRCLSSYYHGPIPASAAGCLVVNYSGLQMEELDRFLDALERT